MALTFLPAPKGSRWQAGQSGNPKGTAHSRSLQQLARTHTEAALNTLVLALRNPRERVPAAIAILDRGWGRPAQRIETDGASHLHLHLLAAQMVEAVAIEARPEPERQAVIEGSVPTE